MLAIRNGLNTISMLSLPIFSEVCVWREKYSWNGLYKLLVINSKKGLVKVILISKMVTGTLMGNNFFKYIFII